MKTDARRVLDHCLAGRPGTQKVPDIEKFPLVPRLIASFGLRSTGAIEDPSVLNIGAAIERVVDFIRKNGHVQTYDRICSYLVKQTTTFHNLVDVQRNCLTDVASIIRECLLGNDISFDVKELRKDRRFQGAMEISAKVVGGVRSDSLRRCTSCHLVGKGDVHFRRIKVAGKWGYSEFCIYCQPSEWYSDLLGKK